MELNTTTEDIDRELDNVVCTILSAQGYLERLQSREVPDAQAIALDLASALTSLDWIRKLLIALDSVGQNLEASAVRCD